MRQVFVLSIVMFLRGLGLWVGYKLEPSALAVMAGVVLGVLASIPTALVFLIVHRITTRKSEPAAASQPQYPPVIVVGGIPQQLPASPGAQSSESVDGSWWPAEERRPKFRMLGEE